MSHGLSDANFAYREALVAVGRDIRHEAFLVGFSDTIILQSAVLGLALVAALFMRKTSDAPVGGGAH
jgi:DHA2 family multidrug resistance protein